MSDRIPLLLDVDTGIDDALALALAVRSPRAELVAVSTVAGNVGVERTTANTLAVLDLLGATAIPVHRGASRPLVRAHRDATYFHGVSGLGTARLPPSARPHGPDRGPAAIIRHANARPGELTLVCTGPLTNLAIALNVEPDLPNLLREVVIMGGAFWERGNVTEHAEFNAYCDPEAFDQVLQTPFPRLTVVGLDVTHPTVLARAIWQAATRRTDDPVALLVAEVCRQAFTERDRASIYLHDPLAVGVALDPTLITVETGAIDVALFGEEVGRTRVVDAGTVRVARTVDAARFMTAFVTALELPSDV